MFVTLQPHVADSYSLEEMKDHVLFPPEFGTAISTLHHQQLHILQYHLTTCLLVQLRLINVSTESRLVSS